ncbi:MAG: hypothetical protein JSR96_04230 [Proteobacteria bacterium]|nr:hypothetical protein [Pseudomonadota bacterium]
MKRASIAITTAFLIIPSIGHAQDAPANAAMIVAPSDIAFAKVLPANTEVVLSVNQTLTTKGNSLHEGDTFALTVVQDVFLEDRIIIPRGSRAIGRVNWLTSKGAFGKSGKMEVSVEYVEVGGRRIPLEGHFRQEGEGNTVATVGGVVLAGVFAGFITGRSGVIPQGRELLVHTKNDLPVRFAAQRATSAPLPVATAHNTSQVAYSQQPEARKPKPWGLESVEVK